MNSSGVGAALVFLLLFIASVEAAEGGVTFWRKNFKMNCPEAGKWFKKTQLGITVSKTHEIEYSSNTKGLYHCQYTDEKKTYYFYVKGKVCEDCYELDAAAVGYVLAVDVVATACLMAIVYRCTKKRRSAGLTHASKAPARPAGRPPPVQAPDYEQLSPHTRSQDPYSAVSRMR
ncbi:T-cell surface glycoprotein CD3 epsilon chain-like [Clinocottus analis]|uniref:T-cell surface glycoprotein CD3 epsilon chain-like n=1 Tax=Clinocottus analis TaxID=304258 RepID=UPI0035C0DA4F